MDKSGEKTLQEVLHDVVKARTFIIAGALFGAVIALVVGLCSVPQYKAQMIVGPAQPLNGAEVSSLLANDNLFALRHLVQRVGSMNDTDFLRFENIYDGPSIAEELLKEKTIRRGMAVARRFKFMAPPEISTSADLAEYLHKNVKLDPVAATTLRRLIYSHPDPQFAAYFLKRIHDLSDRHIRNDIKRDTTQRVAYLRKAMEDASNPEHRRALTTLLMEQERLRMLVSIDQPYAAAVIEPPAAKSHPVWPDYPFLFSILMLGFGFLGFIVYGLKHDA